MTPVDETRDSETEVKAQVREMTAHFLVPRQTAQLFAKLDSASTSLIPAYKPTFSAFRGSMCSAVSTISMPFALVSASVHRSHFQRIYAASRIRALAYDWGADETFAKAESQMREWNASEEGERAIIADICKFLMDSSKNGLDSAAHDLLRQGLVLTWSAFEVLFRDTFETVLNQEPGRIQALMTDSSVRKRFDAQRLPLDILVQHGFDLSTKLGTVLVRQNDFSDLPFIKALYRALFVGDSELNDRLADRLLWTLYQRRNLIVHKNAIVDQLYLDATGETLIVGERLAVIPDDFDRCFDVIVRAGAALMVCLSKRCEPLSG
jgi:hypothetical protein